MMCIRKIMAGQKGAVAIMVGLGLVVFLSFTALVVDIGFILVTKNELHNVADASALAGNRQLGKIYEGLTTFSAQQSYVLTGADETLIRNAVLDAAGKNSAGGKYITTFGASDIRIGQWDGKTRTLTVTNNNPDAVEVTAHRDATANGPITTFFARLMGINEASVTSTSKREGGLWTGVERPTAALTGPSKVEPGELDLPVGISKKWFTDGFCDQNIKFYPTDETGCAGWHTFNLGVGKDNTNTNTEILRNDILQQMPPFGTYEAPGFTVGDPDAKVNFTNGNLAAAFPDLKALYDANKNAAGVWETFVVVYDSTDCNPNESLPIAGFASVAVTNVQESPEKIIEGTVECKLVRPDTRGGGAYYGTKGSIPGLVQ